MRKLSVTAGDNVGGWTFLRPSQKRVSGSVAWFVSCPACGREQKQAVRPLQARPRMEAGTMECGYGDCKLSRRQRGGEAARTRREEMRRRWAAGEQLADIAAAYGVTPQRVWQIVSDTMSDDEVLTVIAVADPIRVRSAAVRLAPADRRRLVILMGPSA